MSLIESWKRRLCFSSFDQESNLCASRPINQRIVVYLSFGPLRTYALVISDSTMAPSGPQEMRVMYVFMRHTVL